MAWFDATVDILGFSAREFRQMMISSIVAGVIGFVICYNWGTTRRLKNLRKDILKEFSKVKPANKGGQVAVFHPEERVWEIGTAYGKLRLRTDENVSRDLIKWLENNGLLAPLDDSE